jgi:hypothetical protein
MEARKLACQALHDFYTRAVAPRVMAAAAKGHLETTIKWSELDKPLLSARQFYIAMQECQTATRGERTYPRTELEYDYDGLYSIHTLVGKSYAMSKSVSGVTLRW